MDLAAYSALVTCLKTRCSCKVVPPSPLPLPPSPPVTFGCCDTGRMCAPAPRRRHAHAHAHAQVLTRVLLGVRHGARVEPRLYKRRDFSHKCCIESRVLACARLRGKGREGGSNTPRAELQARWNWSRLLGSFSTFISFPSGLAVQLTSDIQGQGGSKKKYSG